MTPLLLIVAHLETMTLISSRHQKQGLYFMSEREKGWALQGDRKDIWKAETSQAGLIE
jgi:hypothetical protein